MKNLLKEVEHELTVLDGLYATDKDLAFLPNEYCWKIDTSKILKKVSDKLNNISSNDQEDIINRIESILNEMKNMNQIIKMNPHVSEVDRIYFDNRFGILKMEYDYLMILLEP